MSTPRLTTPRWNVGHARITRILDLEAAGLGFLLPDATPENLRSIPWIAPYVAGDGEAVAAIQSFVVELDGRRIVVDTGAGPGAREAIPARIERATAYLDDLARAGFAPETIDTVVHTHLHFDHVGWNLRPSGGGWEPTFPRARHLVIAREWAHWTGEGADPERAPVDRALRPLVAAERVDFVDSGHEVAPGMVLEATPGHTPGHVSVRIASNGATAFISGDIMHHPSQVARPEWSCTWDSDPAQARATRLAFLERMAGTDVVVFGSHFAHAPAGTIARNGDIYRFEVVTPEE